MNYAIDLAPLWGLMVGINYWNSYMNDDHEKPTYHSVQICFLVVAVVVTWHD